MKAATSWRLALTVVLLASLASSGLAGRPAYADPGEIRVT